MTVRRTRVIDKWRWLVAGARRLAAAVPVLGLLVGVPVAPAAVGVAGRALACDQPGVPAAGVPWPQRMLGFERVRPVADGTGVVVAVIDTGVYASHPQLRDRVLTGVDLLTGLPGGNHACDTHGTNVAGIIAAAPTVDGVSGVAPGARILPVLVADRTASLSGSAEADPELLAAGIDWARQFGVDIINISMSFYNDNALVRNAVARAQAEGIVIVAAAGNEGGADSPNPTPYPAAYPGVIGVGAIDQSGLRDPDSGHGPYVDLVAPGVDVTVLQRGGGTWVVSGSSFAAAFVSGTVALLLSRWPDLTPEQVGQRLQATATPAAGPKDGYGAGVLSPYHAVTDQWTEASARPLPGLPSYAPPSPPSDAAARRAGLAAGVAVVAAVAVLAGAALVPRGRRRRWRPGLAPPRATSTLDDRVRPPVRLFSDLE